MPCVPGDWASGIRSSLWQARACHTKTYYPAACFFSQVERQGQFTVAVAVTTLELLIPHLETAGPQSPRLSSVNIVVGFNNYVLIKRESFGGVGGVRVGGWAQHCPLTSTSLRSHSSTVFFFVASFPFHLVEPPDFPSISCRCQQCLYVRSNDWLKIWLL